ncbi:hypothetical protein K469DRAFT_740567 [Zopfia rhizophila CBS 207.26]|uniref:Amino acid transporter n=1 Tax=Zopfia rhizophila CBS 207.26 TaxID=1314779 RepID=A0A6A6DR88_9PEZI|nr:hypothetical protein K469DRAFT_740567 [Zopfia rhizophila CBS 207.26]
MQDDSPVAASEPSDEQTIARFGKKQQVLPPRSALNNGIDNSVVLSWEGVLLGIQPSLFNGGPTGLITAYPIVFIGVYSQTLVMAEMASMIPLSGAVSAYLVANLIVALSSARYPDYQVQTWHGTLVFYAIIALGILINTYLGVVFPTLESIVFILHVIGTAQAVLAGAVPIMLGFAGSDAGSHIAEEIKNAPKVIPFAMIINIFSFFILGYSMIILVLFCTSTDEVLTSTFSFPILPIFVNVTHSLLATAALISMIIFIGLCGAWDLQATASQMLWAFAREDGVPLSRYISKIDARTSLPVCAIGVTSVMSMLLALIGLFSTTAFSAFAGLTVAGFYTAFIVSASLMLWRRIVTPPANIHWGSFRLGRLGIPITIFSLAYSIVGIIFSFWPQVAAVTLKTFNWSVVVYVGFLLLAMARWVVGVKNRYSGPKIEIAGEQRIELFERRTE